jgi:hypothetical protein
MPRRRCVDAVEIAVTPAAFTCCSPGRVRSNRCECAVPTTSLPSNVARLRSYRKAFLSRSIVSSDGGPKFIDRQNVE